MISLSIALTLLTAPAQITQAPQSAPTTYAIKRTFSATDKAKYDVKVNLDIPGQPLEISGLVGVKVDKLLENKKATIVMSVENFKSNGPADGDPSDFVVNCDEHAVGDEIGDGNAHVVMSALAVLSALPATDLKVGDPFSFDLKMTNGGLTGKGTLKDVKDVETRKIAYLEWTGTLNTDGGDFGLKVKSQIDVSNGRIIGASCDIENGQITGKISVDEKKIGS